MVILFGLSAFLYLFRILIKMSKWKFEPMLLDYGENKYEKFGFENALYA